MSSSFARTPMLLLCVRANNLRCLLKSPIVVVYWTPWFGKQRRGNDSEFFKKFSPSNCPVNDILLDGDEHEILPWCIYTHNQQRARNASALVFHAPSLSLSGLPKRNNEQAWVIESMESAAYYSSLTQHSIMRLFNYSMTYRLDSDFPLTYARPFSIVQQISSPLPSGTFTQRKSLTRGEAPILWLASNCRAKNGRSSYVEELRKYIPVDCLGGCLLNGPKTPRHKTGEVLKSYKFYLSFENSNCKDYVTEKLFRPLKAGVIPIVSGPPGKHGDGYKHFAPTNKSFIFPDAYPHPKLLAEHLRHVESNETEWMSYMSYRGAEGYKHFSRDFLSVWGKEQYDWGHCGLCRQLLRIKKHQLMSKERLLPKVVGPDTSCMPPGSLRQLAFRNIS
ncbi:glycosyl transferase [Dunaliella salina]|uniref:Fucosyltransferase n=1 Tax=Dunaliella salina TaxID=3046 RepID=A0ABQ7FW34_DUNSA|nr:glycosyl transferase [Dunaliella salina]|eukprot:KAF5826593.1 glycosyl transferase [Dunaliella salina]